MFMMMMLRCFVLCIVCVIIIIILIKGKVHPRTGHEGPEVE